MMRTTFHEELDSISDQLVEMTRIAGSAIARATTALLDADLHLAEDVITGDRTLDHSRENLDLLAVDVLARQQPVALLFGAETSGLTTAEVNKCQIIIHIPANPEFTSLNLASAVPVSYTHLTLPTSDLV